MKKLSIKNIATSAITFAQACLFLTLFVAPQNVSADEPVDGRADLPPYRLVDGHTAGGLPRGHVGMELRVYAPRDVLGSGLVGSIIAGVTDRLTIGLSYGGEGVIGYGDDVEFYRVPGIRAWVPYIGAMIKYRLFDETFLLPAFTVGFDNQGFGGIAHEGVYGYDGYVFKSPGLFVAASKNFIMLNVVQLGFHGVANYSFEETNNVRWPNLLAGMDIGINDEISFVTEYNFAFDDITAGETRRYGYVLGGFLNFGLRWAFTPSFHLQFDVRDVFENKTRRTDPIYNDEGDTVVDWNRRPIGWSRELKIIYIARF